MQYIINFKEKFLLRAPASQPLMSKASYYAIFDHLFMINKLVIKLCFVSPTEALLQTVIGVLFEDVNLFSFASTF